MTEREKIISLAEHCDFYAPGGLPSDWGEEYFMASPAQIEAFYHAAQDEAYDQVIEFVRNKNYDNDPYILARKIEEMKEQS